MQGIFGGQPISNDVGIDPELTALATENERMATAIPYVNVFVDGEQKLVRYDIFVGILFKKQVPPLMMYHAAGGVCGESGELFDWIKKHLAYGQELNREEVIKEIGDCRFYLQALMNLLNISEYDVLQGNANKLGKRYVGLVYSDEAAKARADYAENQGDQHE